MITRRSALLLAGTVVLAGCAGPSREGSTKGMMELVSSKLPRNPATPDTTTAGAKAVTGFTADLFAQLTAGSHDNLVCSPLSVAIALGMTATGARGATATEILSALHSTDVTELADGLNALDQALSSRSKTVPAPGGGDPLQIALSSASSLWGQRGITWQQDFLDLLARDFGSGMRTVDYETDSEGARSAINAWVSEQTRDRIPELLARGVLTAASRLALVNALYLKAPWQTPFETDATADTPFHLLDGSTASVKMMNSNGYFGLTTADTWTAVDIPYAGGDLAMAVILPSPGAFADVQKGITGSWLADVFTGFVATDVHLGLPRWTMRTQVELTRAISDLGVRTAFSARADFSGMTTQEPLQIAAVVHEGFIAVDEAGTEAAAATAVVMRAEAAQIDPPASVVLDRPFIYVIHDVPARTPLFIGRVMDPAAT